MWSSAAGRFHAGAWLLWLAAAMLAALSMRNPIYLAIIIAVAWAVSAWLERSERIGTGATTVLNPEDPTKRGRGMLLRAVLGLTVLVAFLKGISLHLGD